MHDINASFVSDSRTLFKQQLNKRVLGGISKILEYKMILSYDKHDIDENILV